MDTQTKKVVFFTILGGLAVVTIAYFISKKTTQVIQAVSDKTTEAILKTLNPKVQAKARLFIQKCKEAGINIRITSGLRTCAEQNALYNQGRTTAGAIVTQAKCGQSLHNYALAFDVVDIQKGYNADWDKIGKIGQSVGLEWGGAWKGFVDRPHFQMTFGNSLTELQRKCPTPESCNI